MNTSIFAVGMFVGIIVTLLIVFAIKVSTDSIENIESRFDAEDAERLAFLDENLCDAVYNPAMHKWGIVTQDRKFLSSGDSLHEAIADAQRAFYKAAGA